MPIAGHCACRFPRPTEQAKLLGNLHSRREEMQKCFTSLLDAFCRCRWGSAPWLLLARAMLPVARSVSFVADRFTSCCLRLYIKVTARAAGHGGRNGFTCSKRWPRPRGWNSQKRGRARGVLWEGDVVAVTVKSIIRLWTLEKHP
jgi:hypothetical protein